MSLETFIAERGPAWDRLSALAGALSRRGPRGVPPREVSEMVHLYRDVAADLARLRAMEADPRLVDRINRLVSLAHGQIYRARGRRSIRLGWFFLERHPRLFRETWRFTLASFLVSLLAFVLAFRTVEERPHVIADILGGADLELSGKKTASDISGKFKAIPGPVLSSLVTTNNIKVALAAFALGVTFGVGTIYILIVNGAMLGGFAGAYARSGIAGDFWMTVLPHGALELSAIVVAGGAGLILGWSLCAPGPRTRARALREEAMRAAELVIGLVPAFLVAGFFEGFVTPSDAIPRGLKVALGAAAAALFWSHLLVGGRRTDRRGEEALK